MSEHTGRDPGLPDRSDWEDRLVDRALQELHGDRPPDLLASIERRLMEESALPLPLRGVTRMVHRPVRLAAGLLFAAALLFMAIALAVHWSSGRGERVPAVQVAVEVLRGRLELMDGSVAVAPRILEPGAVEMVLLQRGDRMRSLPHGYSDGTELVLGPFGMIRLAPQTLLEVKEMDVSLKNGWVAAGSLTFAVVTGAASWHLITQREHAEAGEVLKLEAPNQSALQDQLQTAQAESVRAQRENQDLKRQLTELQNQLARQPAPKIEEPRVEAPAATTPDKPAEVAFDDPRFREVLAGVDWSKMGKITNEMAGLLVELAKAVEEGKDLPTDLAIKVSKLNLEFAEPVVKLLEAKLPGYGPNGAFSHPLVVGNMLASVLEQGGQPLTSEQRSMLAGLVKYYSGENEGIHGAPAELELDKLCAEAAMKDRLYEELSQKLTPEQRRLMYPEGASSFDGDNLFRTGVMWRMYGTPVPTATPAAYAEHSAKNVVDKLGLDETAAAQVRQIIGQVAQQAPSEMWTKGSAAEHSDAHFLRTGRTMRAAQTQQNWMRRVLREVSLSPEQRARLQQLPKVFVPVPR